MPVCMCTYVFICIYKYVLPLGGVCLYGSKGFFQDSWSSGKYIASKYYIYIYVNYIYNFVYYIY